MAGTHCTEKQTVLLLKVREGHVQMRNEEKKLGNVGTAAVVNTVGACPTRMAGEFMKNPSSGLRALAVEMSQDFRGRMETDQ